MTTVHDFNSGGHLASAALFPRCSRSWRFAYHAPSMRAEDLIALAAVRGVDLTGAAALPANSTTQE